MTTAGRKKTTATKRAEASAAATRKTINRKDNTMAETDLTLLKLNAKLDALNKSQAVIEFNLDGTIITANDNFLNVLGYTLDEIEGQHHRMFVDEVVGHSSEYRAFWKKLNRGEFDAGEYKRLGKDGREVWIQASYNPIFDENGEPFMVVKYATDVTREKLERANIEGQFEAIGKSQAVIEFNMDGTIINANENFLSAVGYTFDEIRGRHHSIFVEPAYRQSAEYALFWENLNRGIYSSGEYKRIAKGGREVWIQASYNPIIDMNGRPFKVVKYATDITDQKLQQADFEGQINAIGKSQAVIEFNMDGTIVTANANFLDAVGYSLEEVRGKHHGIFVEPAYRQSPEYAAFWDSLNRGEYAAGEFKRIAKGGNEIWIQASYNPILDLNGKPFKVVKYASDITAQKIAAIEAEKAREVYVGEVGRVVDACKQGDLSVRGNLDILNESYVPIMTGINDVINAIVRPIEELQTQLKKVAEGDLTAYITGEYQGDHEFLKKALNRTLDSLNDILNQVRSGADQIASGSNQVSDSSQSISQGATEQAASLEQITSSMTEMAGQVKQNAENANQANQLAGTAKGSAEQGNNQMADMVSAMGEIEESSQNIQKIIKVIDEIAFQTNLLALNAAVEAARAGVHGKGFAVVAEEVRNLAARSANAAKETTELIEGSIKKVSNGTGIANKTAEALREIVDGISKVTDLVGEIAAASSEQAQGISQVNQGLVQLDKVTQQNTANAEESASAAVELSSQATQLQEVLTRFTLASAGAGADSALAGITPEMIEAIRRIVASENAANGHSNGNGNSMVRGAMAAMPRTRHAVGAGVDPNTIIPLDDADMGRY